MTNWDLWQELFPKMIYAILCGGLVGFEREIKRSAAGMKTQIMICLGSALYTACAATIVSIQSKSDLSRIIAQIVSGIGFLGAGAIIRGSKDRIIGLTTAALIWLVAAIGILVGLGYGPLALGVSGTIVTIITVISFVETKFIRRAGVHETPAAIRDGHLKSRDSADDSN